MNVDIRLAEPSDVSALFHIRTSVRENHLSPQRLTEMGITEGSISAMISASPCAWVATVGTKVVGFSMIDLEEACLFAAFVLPEHEGKGIGSKLLQQAESELFQHHSKIWLETDKRSRAAEFYRRLGWSSEREAEGNQIRLSKTRP